MTSKTIKPDTQQTEATLLLVDDDHDIRTLLAQQLELHNFRVIQAQNGTELTNNVHNHTIDLIILDLNLGVEDGLDICKGLRETSNIPVIMLTARGNADDRLLGFENGADDYLPKPFDPRELLARIRSVLRRTQTGLAPTVLRTSYIQFGSWTLDMELRRMIDAEGRAIILSNTEFRLLRLFLDNAGDILRREQLIALGASHNEQALDRAVDLQVSRLRTKLNDQGPPYSMIETVRQKGYRLIVPVYPSETL
ncbi:response regulator transcription factor [Kordiimonas pumila]|uniref:Response regulator transcription factor n=1 Tax=Kordiimonas pumila TaxID=2161677 RepID=A0ABV7D5Y3_9PROT|nr:response regulator transcription factor [Kordiimonas pumila]